MSTQKIALVFITVLISSCNVPSVNPTVTPVFQQLRIVNSGVQDIEGLVVLFPGSTADSEAIEVEYGDVPAGATTEYQNVPGGVYQYSAYEYFWKGGLVTQPVIDWVGESPMTGDKFTYSILLDPQSVEGNQMQLMAVLVDVP